VRRGICRLVAMLTAVPGIDEVAMTTNGVLLVQFAVDLKAAGLTRLNISLDTLDRDKFREICRRDDLPRVLEGIAAARRAGFAEIKLNAVAIRGQSEDDMVPLARFARQEGMELRFIEFMPLDADGRWREGGVLSGGEILRRLAAEIGPLVPVIEPSGRAPAAQYRFADGIGSIGVIASVSQPFCHHCGRLRLTAEGAIRNCLFSTADWDARALLRSGASDAALADLLRRAVRAKERQHGTDAGQFAKPQHAMYEIGG
jgi:GTP 3',8-cyclase